MAILSILRLISYSFNTNFLLVNFAIVKKNMSEVEINIARGRGALDNCYISWSSTCKIGCQVEYKIHYTYSCKFSFPLFSFFFYTQI